MILFQSNTWVLVHHTYGLLGFVCSLRDQLQGACWLTGLVDWKFFSSLPNYSQMKPFWSLWIGTSFLLVPLLPLSIFTGDRLTKLLVLSWGCFSALSTFSVSWALYLPLVYLHFPSQGFFSASFFLFFFQFCFTSSLLFSIITELAWTPFPLLIPSTMTSLSYFLSCSALCSSTKGLSSGISTWISSFCGCSGALWACSKGLEN